MTEHTSSQSRNTPGKTRRNTPGDPPGAPYGSTAGGAPEETDGSSTAGGRSPGDTVGGRLPADTAGVRSPADTAGSTRGPALEPRSAAADGPALLGRVALVTGGSRGIGAATALRLARDGADIAVTYVQGKEAAAEVVRAVEALGRRAVALRADAGDPDEAAGAVAAAVRELGRLDVLVNNAGVGLLGPMESLSAADVDRVLAVNVRGAFLTSRAALAHLPRGGRIVTVGTCMAQRVPGPGGTLYAMSKAALVGLTRALAREVGGRGITANIVHPGPIDTDMNPADGPFAEGQSTLTALGRFGTAEEVADTIAHLALSGYVTGAEFAVDGGHAA